LAAPIAVLIWLFLTALAVLVGAALNAAFAQVFPDQSSATARLDRGRRLGRRPAARPAGPSDIDDV
jgi:membrane protein